MYTGMKSLKKIGVEVSDRKPPWDCQKGQDAVKMEIKRYLLRLFLIYYSRFKEFDGQYNLEQLGTYSPLTHRSLTAHSPAYSLIHWITYSLAYSLIHSLAGLLTHWLTHSPANSLTYSE